jgi:4-amino-4-deoxy-L-arabinose transferase-like glycosyltransferase
MGKKAREKRDRRELTAPGGAPAGPVARPVASERRAAEPVAVGWPRWSAGDRAVDWSTLALIAGFALVVRGVLLIQVTATPYLEVDNIDAKGYQVWAEQILTNGWWPTQHFYQSPLYAYYLAAVRTIFGDSFWPPRMIQVALGSVSVALLGAIGMRIFNWRVGVLAATMLGLYGPMILEEITLSKTSLLICSALMGFLLFMQARKQRSWSRMMLAGVVFGVTVIGVGQWLIAMLGLAVFTAVDDMVPRQLRLRLAGAFVVGALVVLAPIIIWNSSKGGGLILTSADAGLNLYLGNNPKATALTGRPAGLRDVPEFEEGDSRRLAEGEVGHPLTPAEVSRHWTSRALNWALENPGAFIVNTLRKVTVLWNSYEIPDSYHFAFVREHYLPLLWGSLSFAIVGPLTLLGLVLAWRHRPARALYLVSLCYLGVLALFYVRSRYRLPAVPFLMVFAAAAVDWSIRTVEQRAWQATAMLGGALLVLALFVNRTYCEPPRTDAPAVCFGGDAWFDLEWQKLAEWNEQQGDMETALVNLHRAAAGESLRGPGNLAYWIGKDELEVAQRAVDAGDAAKANEHLPQAVAAFQRALQYSYRVAQSQTLLARAYRLQGRTEQAVAASNAAIAARPNDATILIEALRLQVALKRCENARHIRDDLGRIGGDAAQADQILASCPPS